MQRGLNCRQVHSKSGARTDQSRSANMHFANSRRHLLDCADFFNNEAMRQEPLIDQLHNAFIIWFQPDRPKMSAAYFHTVWL